MALLLAVITLKLSARQQQESKALHVLVHACLGIAMCGGGIFGLFAGFWVCLLLGFQKDDDLLDLPWVAVVLGSIAAGFFGPVVLYKRASRRPRR